MVLQLVCTYKYKTKGCDSMFGWSIEIIGIIILLCALIGIYFGVLYSSFKKYENAEKEAGSVIMELEPSNRILMFRRVDFLAAIGLYIVWCLVDYIREQTIRADGWIVLTGAVASFCLNSKPEKLCENGIVTSFGLFRWDNIKEIMPVDETDHKIKIKLHKRVGGSGKITLYSKPEDIMNVVHVIERKMNSNSEII